MTGDCIVARRIILINHLRVCDRMQRKTHFTLDEAERILSKVKRLLAKLHTLKAQINFLAEEKEAPVQLTEPFSEDEIYRFAFAQEIKINRELHKHTYEFFKTLDLMNELGCVVKELDEGLVDFPYKLNGRDVCLCWKEGEDRISHWHELETGYSGRKPILDLDDLMNPKDSQVRRKPKVREKLV